MTCWIFLPCHGAQEHLYYKAIIAKIEPRVHYFHYGATKSRSGREITTGSRPNSLKKAIFYLVPNKALNRSTFWSLLNVHQRGEKRRFENSHGGIANVSVSYRRPLLRQIKRWRHRITEQFITRTEF